ncbi:MAG: hypothetical protein RLY49_160 [Candidatus Parcubacteria bacterium]|jgi:hypothetical protein
MRKYFSKKIIASILVLLVFCFYFLLAHSPKIDDPEYGVSFNTVYAKELGLNWKQVYDVLFTDLNIKKIRLAAHWNMVEPQKDKFNFEELDYQVKKATEHNADIIFAVGKRLPRWPECHIPDWALNLSKEEQESYILRYIEATINRYEGNPAIKVWQVENEAFLSVYATDHCLNFDKEFLQKEIELVQSIDTKQRPILITDSGELSTWRKAFFYGDIFGTTLYVYSWNEFIGEFRNPFLPGFYTFRANLLNLFREQKKEAIIAELSLEPWLDKPVIKERTEIQMRRMSPQKFDTVIEFAKNTGMKTQYLWGVEWWYYMKLQGEDWYWERAKELFK